MQYLVTTAALAATTLPAVNAAVAAISNHCGVPYYVWSVSEVQSDMVTIPDHTVIYNETYRSRQDNGGGISIKIAKSNDDGSLPADGVSQFEYTITPGNIWYDLSNINGNPLQGISVILEASESSCPTVQCASNDEVCKAAYNQPKEDVNTHACSPTADLVLTLCNDQKASSGGVSKAVSKVASKVSSSMSELNALQVSESGVVSESAATPSTDAPATPSDSPDSSDSSDDGSTIADDLEEAVTFVTFHNPTKRDVLHHAHEHTHSRIRRSRIFRHGGSSS